MLNIALPKGRLGEKIYDVFAKAGYECPSIKENNRKLIFENEEKGVRYFWVKPSDISIYVERGSADIGVCGKDILVEYAPDVYELLDLKKGVCKMAVAGKKDFYDNGENTLKVATKFVHSAKAYYAKKGRAIDVIKLNGSIEIAPILGLSDVIMRKNTRRPSGTWASPRATILSGARLDISCPKKLIAPPLLRSNPETVFRMVLLPAPFAPMRVTISPSFTSKEIPLMAWILP